MEGMVKAKKANVVLTIKEEAADRYLTKGFSIYTLEGELINKAAPQSLADYRTENEELKQRIAELEAELAANNSKSNKVDKVEEVAEPVAEEVDGDAPLFEEPKAKKVAKSKK